MASHRVEVARHLRKAIRKLPGNIRQRVLRALEGLRQQPRPPASQLLDTTQEGIRLEAGAELRRLRIEAWRIVYLLEPADRLITILAIRKRPPYQYEDLEELVASLAE